MPRAKQVPSFVYNIWGRLPPPLRRICFRLATPKVSMGAVAVITDAHGRVLLARHTYRTPAWDLPGGLIGSSEQPDQALARELGEELGLSSRIGPLLHAEVCAEMRHLTLFYQASIANAPRPDGVEIDAVRYATRAEWLELTGHPVCRWPVPAQPLPATA